MAKRTGTTASAVSRYENAEYDRYELRTLQRIVRACGGRLNITLEPGPKNRGPRLTEPPKSGRRVLRNGV